MVDLLYIGEVNIKDLKQIYGEVEQANFDANLKFKFVKKTRKGCVYHTVIELSKFKLLIAFNFVFKKDSPGLVITAHITKEGTLDSRYFVPKGMNYQSQLNGIRKLISNRLRSRFIQFIRDELRKFFPRGLDRPEDRTLEPNATFYNPIPGQKQHHGPIGWSMYTDEQIIKRLTEEENFLQVKKLEDGSWVGLYPLMYTLSVCTDISVDSPYVYRWCFKNPEEAKKFFNEIKEFDEVPGSRESLVGHRFNGLARLQITDELGLKKW